MKSKPFIKRGVVPATGTVVIVTGLGEDARYRVLRREFRALGSSGGQATLNVNGGGSPLFTELVLPPADAAISYESNAPAPYGGDVTLAVSSLPTEGQLQYCLELQLETKDD